MMDPRIKRPTTNDLLELRHKEWVKSLSYEVSDGTPVIIKLPMCRFGKTAKILSERELEVLQLISFGFTTEEIANRLILSPHTITNHRKNMLTRSRCGNLVELIRVALNENLL